MSKALEKRLAKIEAKLNPQPKGNFDLVKHIQDIRLESERLMELCESDYSAEMMKPPGSKVNQIARVEVAYQKTFDAMNPEDKQRTLGYASFDPLEYARTMEERTRTLTSPDNWVTHLFAERTRKLREEQSMTRSR